MRAACLVRKLGFLWKLTDDGAESASLLGASVLDEWGGERASTLLIRECLDLEDVYGTGFSEALCDKAADRPCKRKIKDVILGLDRNALIDEGMGRCDASVVARLRGMWVGADCGTVAVIVGLKLSLDFEPS